VPASVVAIAVVISSRSTSASRRLAAGSHPSIRSRRRAPTIAP
jgi:hypothetical protein